MSPPSQRVALVVSDVEAAVGALARILRDAGHHVDVVVTQKERPAFDGHAHLPEGTLTLAQALGSYDAAIALSWRAWYPMFGLDARGYGHWVRADERAGAGALAPLVERSYREPDVALFAASESARIAAELSTLPGPPSGRRAELAAIGRLLDAPAGAVMPARNPVAERARVFARHAVRTVRQSLQRMVVEGPSRPTPGERLPGEPVLFVGQPQYFRSVWYDAIRDGWGQAAPVSVTALDALADLPGRVRASGARTVVVFQPEHLAGVPAAAAALRADGVRLVVYSTEPVPLDGERERHWDQVRRLDNLRSARSVPWDLVVHYDGASAGVVAAEAIAPVVVHPLPVSEALFYAEPEVAPDYDVCFLGWSTPHRESFLFPLRCRYRTVHVAHGIFDEEARRLMNRSRLIVNLHAHAYPNFENRCVQALFCGRPLVSEPLSNDLLVPGVDFLLARTPEELLYHAEALFELGVPAPRPTFDRSRFRAASLRRLLAERAS